MSAIHFIVNPLRPSIGMRWPYEDMKIQKHTKNFRVHFSRGRLHAEILARKAIAEEASLIVAVGGDSTLSEIVNGIHRAKLGNYKVPPLAFYPELQQGDFVRSFQLRPTIDEFLSLYLQGSLTTEHIDIGQVEYTGEYGQKIRRVFTNAAGCGFSSVVVHKLSQDYRMKRSKWNFIKLLGTLVPFYRSSLMEIICDGKKVLEGEELLSALVHNGQFAGHGLPFSPESNLRDGLFEVQFIKTALPINYLMGAFQLFAGRLKNAKFVETMKAKEIHFLPKASQRRIKMDFDGDAWGFLPMRVNVLESALEIIR